MVGGFRTKAFVVIGPPDYVSTYSSKIRGMGGKVLSGVGEGRPDVVIAQKSYFEERCRAGDASLGSILTDAIPVVDENWLTMCEQEDFFVQPSRELRLDLHVDRSAFRSESSGTFSAAQAQPQPQTQKSAAAATATKSPPVAAARHVDPAAGGFGVPRYEPSPGQITPPGKGKQSTATAFASSPPAQPQPVPAGGLFSVPTYDASPGQKAKTPPQSGPFGIPVFNAPQQPQAQAFKAPAEPQPKFGFSANDAVGFGVAVSQSQGSQNTVFQLQPLTATAAPQARTQTQPAPTVSTAAAAPGIPFQFVKTQTPEWGDDFPIACFASIQDMTSFPLPPIGRAFSPAQPAAAGASRATTSAFGQPAFGSQQRPPVLPFGASQPSTAQSPAAKSIRGKTQPAQPAAPFGAVPAQFPTPVERKPIRAEKVPRKVSPAVPAQPAIPAPSVAPFQLARPVQPAQPAAASKRKSAKPKPKAVNTAKITKVSASPWAAPSNTELVPESPNLSRLPTWDTETPLLLLEYDSSGWCQNPHWKDEFGLPFGEMKGGLRNPPFFVNSDEENAFIEQNDQRLRELYVKDRNNAVFNDKYVSLIDVYSTEHYRSFMRSNLTAKEHQIPRVLQQWTRFSRLSPSVTDRITFADKFQQFTQGQLNGMNWNNVFAAGGCVLACLMRDEDNLTSGFRGSDIDLFLYGLSDEEGIKKIEEIFAIVSQNRSRKAGSNFIPPEIVRTPHAVTIVGDYPYRHIQIVLRMYKNPAEVIIGFDIDSCAVGYDGERAFTTLRARRSLNKRINVVSMTRRSTTYEVRLHKYAKRGFAVAVPGLRLDRVPLSVYQQGQRKQQGLAKLLSLDEVERKSVEKWKEENNGSNLSIASSARGAGGSADHRLQAAAFRGARAGRAARGMARRAPPARPGERRRKRIERLRARMEARGYNYTGQPGRPKPADWTEKSDYNVLLLPWGPAWHNWNLTRFLMRKDKAQLFSGEAHKHVAVIGLQSVLTGKSGWCHMCRDGVPTADDGSLNVQYVSGSLRWFRENPGNQLLTGSFHPVTDEHYDDGCYTDEPVPLRPHLRAFGTSFAPVVPQDAQSPSRAFPAKSFFPLPATTSHTVAPALPAPQQAKVPVEISNPGTLAIVHSPGFNFPPDGRLTIFEFGSIFRVKSGKKTMQNAADWEFMNLAFPDGIRRAASASSDSRVVIMGVFDQIFDDSFTRQTLLDGMAQMIGSLGCNVCFMIDFDSLPSIGLWTNFRRLFAPRPIRAVDFYVDSKRTPSVKLGFNIGAACHDISELWNPGAAILNEAVTQQRDELSKIPRGRPPQQVRAPEVVVLVGCPCSGKTAFAKKHFLSKGYRAVAPRNVEKCIQQAADALLNGLGVVVDGGNPTRDHRSDFISLARNFGVPVRCLVLDTPIAIAKHLNAVRIMKSSFDEGNVYYNESAFQLYTSSLQKPTTKEGFDEVEAIPFGIEVDGPLDEKYFFMLT